MAQTIGTSRSFGAAALHHLSGSIKVVRRILVNALNLLLVWQERAEQRQALGELNERMLKDIGVSPSDAYLEARKPFWRS